MDSPVGRGRMLVSWPSAKGEKVALVLKEMQRRCTLHSPRQEEFYFAAIQTPWLVRKHLAIQRNNKRY